MDAACLIQADDPCRNTAQNRFGKTHALVQLPVGLYQALLLCLQLGCHFVEGPSQCTDFIGAGGFLDTGPQLATGDPFGS